MTSDEVVPGVGDVRSDDELARWRRGPEDAVVPGEGDVMPDDEVLTGGNVTPVVRRGDRVRREAGDWTPTVQALLAHVRAAGVTEVPEPHGIDADGREVLAYLDGEVPSGGPLPAWLWEEQVLVDAARLLRRFHDATVGFLAASSGDTTHGTSDAASGGRAVRTTDSTDGRPGSAVSPVWRMDPHEPVEVVCHNDVAPYNLVFRGGRVVGLIDHDHASPGPRVWDLAYLAYRLVPLQSPRNPEHPGGTVGRSRDDRLELLCRSYGNPAPGEPWAAITPAAILRLLPQRIAELRAYTAGRAEAEPDGPFWDHLTVYDEDLAHLSHLAELVPTDGGE